MADYQQAVTYLNGDSGMANIIHDLDASSTTYTIVYNNADDDSYDPSTHMIHWDPHSALRCSGGGKQTPALGVRPRNGPCGSALVLGLDWMGSMARLRQSGRAPRNRGA